MDKSKPVGGIPLTEVVGQLRREISEAVEKAEGKDLRFRLEKVQVELEVAVARTGKGETKAKFYVLEFGVGGEVAHSRTQKIVLDLTPIPEDEKSETDGVLLGRRPGDSS